MPRKPVDGTELVAQHWPTNGPHTEESLASAAMAIQELIRYMAHATIGTTLSALPFAQDGYIVVGRLAHAMSSQEQVLRQLSAWANTLAADPQLRHDSDASAAMAAIEASEYLRDAAGRADSLGRLLGDAQSALGHLYHDVDD